MVKFFAGRRGIRRIVLSVTALFLAAALIVGNIFLDLYSPLLHAFFANSSMIATTTEAKNALAQADELVREIAEESVVLLKNETVDGAPFLPRPLSEKFNLFGWGATDDGFLLVGGGSGGTNLDGTDERSVTLREGFEEAGIAYNAQLLEAYAALRDFDADFREGGTTGADASQSLFNPPASFYTQELLNDAYRYSPTAVAVLSRWGCEDGGDGELMNIGEYRDGSFLELTEEERAMFSALERGNFNVIVVLNTCNPIELGFLEEFSCIKACLYAGIPGQSGAFAIPELLVGRRYRQTRNELGEVTDAAYREVGKLSPSGRLSDTLAYDHQSHDPTFVNAAVPGDIVYQEGIYVGYKWYETAEEAGYYRAQGTSYEDVVQFPFGFGLSYTDFTQEILSLDCPDGEEGGKLEKDRTYHAVVRVTNIGNFPGRDVVQLYWSAAYCPDGIERASVNLLAFGKTKELQPQEHEDVELTFTAYDMASYDAYDRNRNGFKGYELDPLDYEIKLMKNAHELVSSSEENGEEGARLRVLSCDGIRYEEDPVTGEEVKNRFTGVEAYADMPLDGAGGLTGELTYLSRDDAFRNFPTVRAPQRNDVAENASNFKCIGASDTEADSPADEPFSEYMLQHKDGSKAELSELNGSAGEEDALVHNDALFKELADWNSPKWEKLLNALSENEIKDLIGKGGFQTVALESVGKPRNQDNNGSAGFNVYANSGAKNECTVFPAESLMGCSWSTRLTYELGHMQGFIGEAMKIQGWYAPGVNLHRSVFNSRNFEYYSEDGILSGKLAAETVHGAKENNLYCYVKHFVLSESGEAPEDWYTWTTEQALRENYLKPFEICVKEGGANAMMSGYNKLGAVWCGYNRALLTDILRGEWGFKGTVVTGRYEGDGYMNDYDTAIQAGCGLWLNSMKSSANISFEVSAVSRAARDTVKGILYTYVDTYDTALEYREKVASGEVEDPYVVTLKVNITAAPYSWLFVFLWTLADVVLVLGVVACVLFMFLPREKKKQEQPKEE